MIIDPGMRKGAVKAPRSKSHEHRLLIADFLAGDDSRLVDVAGDPADIVATKRCLRALRTDNLTPVLECGESGSTRRFLAPIAAALGKQPIFQTSGRMTERPQKYYPVLIPGEFPLEGDVSSQFVTGLLFALPLLSRDSFIRFTTPLESRGYVDMTLRVLRGAGVDVRVCEDGYDVRGNQRYRSQRDVPVEGDWSGAAFWLAMNALGSEIRVDGLDEESAQPDRIVTSALRKIAAVKQGYAIELDMSGCPDLFPVLSVVAGASEGCVTFTGTRRLRLKESDRVAAMADVLGRFGVRTEVRSNSFRVEGAGRSFKGGAFTSFKDHRIAMSIAVGATISATPVEIDDVTCAAKSYPEFFSRFLSARPLYDDFRHARRE